MSGGKIIGIIVRLELLNITWAEYLNEAIQLENSKKETKSVALRSSTPLKIETGSHSKSEHQSFKWVVFCVMVKHISTLNLYVWDNKPHIRKETKLIIKVVVRGCLYGGKLWAVTP
jgi:hypothetical protein